MVWNTYLPSPSHKRSVNYISKYTEGIPQTLWHLKKRFQAIRDQYQHRSHIWCRKYTKKEDNIQEVIHMKKNPSTNQDISIHVFSISYNIKNSMNKKERQSFEESNSRPTYSAPSNAAATPNVPQPQPKSATTFPLMSSNIFSA